MPAMSTRWFALLVLVPLAACRVSLTRDLAPGDVRGQVVVLEAGAEVPLEGARIAVAATRVTGRSDARGRFRLPNLRPGTLEVRVDFTPASGDPLALRLRNVELPSIGNGRAGAVDLGKLVLGRVGSLDVTVVDGTTPLPGARVAVEGVGVITVDAEGKGRLGNLAPGVATLVVEHTGETRRGWGTFDVTVVSATVTAVTLDVRTLPPMVAGSVTGTVEQEGSADRVGFTVTLEHPEGGVPMGETDVDGRFTATDVPPGVYFLVITAPDGAQLRYGPVTVNGDIDLGAFLLLPAALETDRDDDGIPNDTDLCPDLFGDGGGDEDDDGLGNTCDPDIDGDGITNELDFTLELAGDDTLAVVAGSTGHVVEVRVRDGNGALRRGVALDCIAVADAFTIENPSVVSDSNGLAACGFDASTTAGTKHLTIALSGTPTTSLDVIIDVGPDVIARLLLVADGAEPSARAGDPVGVTVTRLDRFRNIVKASLDAVTLTTTDPLVPDFGVATFDGTKAAVRVEGTFHTASLQGVIATLDSDAFVRFELNDLNIVPGIGDRLVVSHEEGPVVAGSIVEFVVDVEDRFGNRGVKEERTLGVSAPPPPDTVIGGPFGFDGSGDEVVVPVQLFKAGAPVVGFAAGGLSDNVEASVTVTAAVPALFTVENLDLPLVSGVPETFDLLLSDAYGNVSTASGAVPLSFVGSTDALGTALMTNGRATVTITPHAAGTFTLRVESPDGGLVAGFPGIVVRHGPTSQLAFIAGGDMRVGVPLQWTAEARDAAGNRVLDEQRAADVFVDTVGSVSYQPRITFEGGQASFLLEAFDVGLITVSLTILSGPSVSQEVDVTAGPFDQVVDFAPVAAAVAWAPVTFRARAVDAIGIATPNGAGLYQLRCDDFDATLPVEREVFGNEVDDIRFTATLRRSGSIECMLRRNGVEVARTVVAVAPASVTVQGLAQVDSVVNGVAVVQFNLRAPVRRLVDVRVEWSLTGTVWANCSVAAGSTEPRFGLVAGPSGVETTHFFTWAAWRDLPGKMSGSVQLRVTPLWKGALEGIRGTLNPLPIDLRSVVGPLRNISNHTNVVSVATVSRELDGTTSIITLERTDAAPVETHFDGTTVGNPIPWTASTGATGVKVVASPRPSEAGGFSFATAQTGPDQVRFHTAPGTMIAVGLAWPPTDLALGDLDRDGDVDALVTSTQARGAWIRNDRGSFALQALTLANGGAGTSAVVGLGDFAGDAVVDAMFGFGGGTSYVEYRRNTLAGVLPLAPWTNVNPSESALRILTGRFDGDARDDAAVLGATSLRLVTGATLRTVPIGTQTVASTVRTLQGNFVAAVAGDVDNDGRDDVVVALSDRRILLYPGARTEANAFLVAQLLLADSGAASVSLALADFSRDGTPDLVISTPARTDVYPIASRKLPALRLSAPLVVPVASETPAGTLLALDSGTGSGLPDLISSDNSGVRRARNLGDAMFGAPETLLTAAIGGSAPTLLLPRRVEGKDAGLFAIVPSASSWMVRSNLDSPVGTSGSVTGTPVDGAVGDFDRDGVDDLALLTDAPAGLYLVLESGSRVVPLSTTGWTTPRFVSAGDFDSDGDVDLLVHEGSGTPVLARNNNVGGFVMSRTSASPSLASSGKPVVADFNNDGADDVLLNLFDGQVSIVMGGSTLFAATLRSASPYSNLSAVAQAAGDFDGDGDIDVAVSFAGPAVSALVIYPYVGSGTLGTASFNGSVPGFSSLIARDLDQDGRDGLIGLRSDGAGIQVIRSEGTLLSLPPMVANNVVVRGGGFVDVLRDGVVDLVTGLLGSAASTLYRHNAGLTTWVSGTGSTVMRAPLEARVFDVTGDGQEDFVTFGADAPGVSGASFHVLPGDRLQTALFGTAQGVALPGSTVGLAIADFQQRGLPDLVFGAGALLEKMSNTSVGTAPSWTQATADTLPLGTAALVREWRFDAQQATGLVVATRSPDAVLKCTHTGALAFSCVQFVATTISGGAIAVVTANLDADLAEEFVLSTDGLVYFGDPNGPGQPLTPLSLPPSRRLALVDLDRDGDLDLVGATSGAESLAWTATNLSSGTFSAPTRYAGVAGENGLLDASSRGHRGDASIVVGGVQAGNNGAVRYLPVAGRQY